MAKRFQHVADIGNGQTVGYSAKPRANRGKWSVVFNGPEGARVQLSTAHDIRGKHPPEEFHAEAVKLIRETYRPPSLFPSLERRGWDELLIEVERSIPHTRPETLRSFRAAIKAAKEILPAVASPADVTEDHVRRFAKLWLAAPNQQSGGKRSPVTLSYYLRALSALSNHAVDLGLLPRNLWKGYKVNTKAERNRKPVPSEEDTSAFFQWVHDRYPEWKSLHALLELKAISASRTADVCQLKSDQLRDGKLTFGADITKTKESRSLPIPADLFKTLKATAGKANLWETLFAEIPKHRKASNGYPDVFSWRTVYYVAFLPFILRHEFHANDLAVSAGVKFTSPNEQSHS